MAKITDETAFGIRMDLANELKLEYLPVEIWAVIGLGRMILTLIGQDFTLDVGEWGLAFSSDEDDQCWIEVVRMEDEESHGS